MFDISMFMNKDNPAFAKEHQQFLAGINKVPVSDVFQERVQDVLSLQERYYQR